MTSSVSSRFGRVIAVIDWLTDIGGFIGALSLLGIFILIGSEIITRNFLGFSLTFSWGLSGYLMGVCFLVASAAAMKSGSHVRVTALVEVASPTYSRALELFACAVGFAICLALSWALIEMAWLAGQRGTTAATAFRMPLVYPRTALAVGAVLMNLQCLAQFLRLIRGEPLAVGQGLE